MPMKPMTAPMPAPIAAEFSDAAPVAAAGADERAALPEAERVGAWTVETDVEFAPVGRALIDGATYELLLDADGVGVGEAAATGYTAGSSDLMSAGRFWYHAGVLPAASDEAICAANADGEARA